MRDRSVVEAFRTDGVPSEMFTSNTARMQAARVAELQELSADDAIPSEMTGGETTRIDATALTGLIEKSEGIAVGTPKRGMPQLEEVARGNTVQVEPRPLPLPAPPELPVVASPVAEAPALAREPVAPPPSRLRDLLFGGAVALAALATWYCVTQL